MLTLTSGLASSFLHPVLKFLCVLPLCWLLMPVPGQDPSQYTLLNYHTDWFQSHTRPDTVRSTACCTRSVCVVMSSVYHPGYESDVEYRSTWSVSVVMSSVCHARYESDVEYCSTRSVSVVMSSVCRARYESDVEYCSTRSVGVVMSSVYHARYESDVESFQRHVSECVSSSRELLYKDPDPDDAHAIRFYRCLSYGLIMSIGGRLYVSLQICL